MASGSEVARLFVTVSADTTKLATGMAGANSMIMGAARGMGIAGGLMTAGITYPLIRIGEQAVDTAATFEQKMNLIGAITGSTAGELDRLSQATQLVGANTDSFGATALTTADAVTELLKAGLSTNEIFGDMDATLRTGALSAGALESAIQLAAASDLNLADAAAFVVTTMATFDVAATDTADATNLFVRAANASILEVSDLQNAFKNAGPTAAIFGFSVEDLTIALAQMSQYGISGAEAGTAFKRMLTNIQRPTKAVTQAMNELGLSLYDQNGEMKDMRTIVSEFSDALFGSGAAAMGMTEQMRNQYIQTIAGVYGMKAMNALLEGGTVGWDQMASSIAGQSSAQEVAAAKMEGFKGAVTMLQKAVTDFIITAATPFMQNFLTPLVGQITGVVQSLSAMNPQFLDIAIKIGLILAAAGPFLLILAGVAAGLGVLLSPIGLVIAGVVALAAAFVASQGGIGPAVAKIQEIGTVIFTAIQPALAWLQGAWATVWGTLGPALAAVGAFILQEFGGLVSWFQANLPLIQATIETVLGAIEAVWNAVWPVLSQVITVVWENIKLVISGALDNLKALLTAGMQIITGDWQGAWESLKGAFANTLSTIGGVLTNTLYGLVGIITGAKGDVIAAGKEMISGLIEGVKAKAADIVNAVKGVVSDALAGAKALLGIHSPSTVLAEVGQNMMLGMAEGISTSESKVIERVSKALGRIVDAFSGLSGLMDKFSGAPGGVPNLGPFLAQFEMVVVQAMTMIAALADRFGGDKQIKKLQKSASYFKSVIEAITVDLSGIKELSLPNLDIWFAQLRDLFDRAMGMMKSIRQTYGDGALETAGELVKSVKALFDLLGVDLKGVVPSENPDFAAAVVLYFQQLELVGAAAMAWLSRISADWAAKIEAAAPLAENIKKLFVLIGVELAKIVPVDAAGFGNTVDRYFGQLEIVGAAVMGWLNRISDEWRARIEAAAPLAENINKLFALIGVELDKIKPSASLDFAGAVDLFFSQLEIVGARIMDWIGRIDEGARAQLAAAAPVMDNITKLFGILNISDLIDKITTQKALGEGETRIPLVDAVTQFLDQIKAVSPLLKAGLDEIDALWGGAMDRAIGIGQKIQSVFETIASAIQAAVGIINNPDWNLDALLAIVGQMQTAMSRINALGAAVGPVVGGMGAVGAAPAVPAGTAPIGGPAATAPVNMGPSATGPAGGEDLGATIRDAIAQAFAGTALEIDLRLEQSQEERRRFSMRLGRLEKAMATMTTKMEASGL